jgi:transposase InsO family protein
VKDIPGRELQVDASFPWGYQKKVVVFTAIDDASRIVYSSIFENHNEVSTMTFLSELISKVPFPIRAIRTDQGREYSRRVQNFLEINHIEHNKNPAYTPQHNGKVERYHRTMKENCTDFWKWNDDIETCGYSLKLWTDYYN